MDLLSVLRILARRWLIFIPALVLTAVTAGVLSTVESATYGASGSVLIVPGATLGEGADVGTADPLLQPTAALLGGALAEAERIDAEEELASDRDDGVAVSVATRPDYPLLDITATGPTADAVLTEAKAAAAAAEVTLTDLQRAGALEITQAVAVRQVAVPRTAVSVDGEHFSATATVMVVAERRLRFHEVGFVAAFLKEKMLDDQVRADLRQRGAGAEIAVSRSEGMDALLRITATGPRPDGVLRTSQMAIDKVSELLDEAQAARGVPDPFRSDVEVLAYPREAEVLESNTMRIVLAVVALGVLASVGAALMVDGIMTSRLGRGRSSTSVPASAGTAGGSDQVAVGTNGRAGQQTRPGVLR